MGTCLDYFAGKECINKEIINSELPLPHSETIVTSENKIDQVKTSRFLLFRRKKIN